MNASADGGGLANAPSSLISDISSDGTRVAFASAASDLGPTDDNGQADVYVRDLTTKEVGLVSVNAAGSSGGNRSSDTPVFSPDGTKIAFLSSATDLGPSDADTDVDVFVRDLSTGIISIVDPPAGPCSSGSSQDPAFSPDGTKLAFVRVLSSSGASDVFVHDLPTETTSLVSVRPSGADCEEGVQALEPVFSPDGAKVAFLSGVYSHDVYIRDLQQATTTLVTVNGDGSGPAGGIHQEEAPSFSPDGTQIVFTTTAGTLGPVDTNSAPDVYIRDLVAGRTDLVTVNLAGTDAASGWNAELSPDGTKVAFHSYQNGHEPIDSDGGFEGIDVYVRDLSADVTSLVSINAAGNDSGNASSGFPVFAGNAKLAFTSGATDLGPTDTNGRGDRYVRDLVAGTTILMSTNSDGSDSIPGGVNGNWISLSNDGGTASFPVIRQASPSGSQSDIHVARYSGRADLLVSFDIDVFGVTPAVTELTASLGVSTRGPDDADEVVASVMLPEGFVFAGWETGEPHVGTCAAPTSQEPRLVRCNVGDLAPGSGGAQFVVRAKLFTPPDNFVSAHGAASSPVIDPDTTNNIVMVTRPVP